MTDTITPASLREHADYVFETGVDASVAHALRGMADEMEAESAREDSLLELAKEFWCGMGGEYDDPDPEDVAQAWDDMTPEWKRRYANGVRAVLAAGGRLLPEGGTVLTAEQVADIRTILPGFGGHAASAAHARLCALFPRTAPPAASVPAGLVDAGKRAADIPDDTPDGTPEKPWPTAADVPEGVRYRSRYSHRWGRMAFINVNGEQHWICSQGSTWPTFRNEADHVELAPFVRVDGDKKESTR